MKLEDCPICKDTGEITLLTSTVPCECQQPTDDFGENVLTDGKGPAEYDSMPPLVTQMLPAEAATTVNVKLVDRRYLFDADGKICGLMPPQPVLDAYQKKADELYRSLKDKLDRLEYGHE